MRQLVQQQVHRLGLVVHQRLDLAEILGRAAFYHVGRQGPGTARETDQRHPAIELAADGADRIHDIAQILAWIGNRQGFDIGKGVDALAKARTFAGLEVQAQAHGVGDGQDVGKQDGCVQRVALQRLQGHFAGHLGVHAQPHEVAGTGAGSAILRQVAARLTHHPHGGDINGLAHQRTQKTVILQFRHEIGIQWRKCSHCNRSRGEDKGRCGKGARRATILPSSSAQAEDPACRLIRSGRWILRLCEG